MDTEGAVWVFDLEGIKLGSLRERPRFFASSVNVEDPLGRTLLALRLGADGVVEWLRGTDRLDLGEGCGCVGLTDVGRSLDELEEEGRETDGRLLDDT